MFRQFERKSEAILSAFGALMLTALFIGAAVIPAETPDNHLAVSGSICV